MYQIYFPATDQTAGPALLLGSVFAGLLGLAFGSFLNVCLSRLPEGESIAWPGSHCRSCSHVLSWWENLPLLSWVLLRGRCRECRARIGIRYPLVESGVGLLWAGCWARFGAGFLPEAEGREFALGLISLIGFALFTWMLVGLAALDAEHFWLPDWVTLTGIGLGIVFTLLRFRPGVRVDEPLTLLQSAYWSAFGILAAAGVVLFIRLAYWLVRRKEGIGLGDAKLMAMLGAWLGLRGAMESFAIAILGATAFAAIWMAIQSLRGNSRQWAGVPLPLGTFLCMGGLTEVFRYGWFWEWWSRAFGLGF